jgi:iron complex outermembrane recepter protein
MCFRANKTVFLFGLILLAVLAGTSGLQAQTKQLVTWVDDLRYLQKASSDEKMQSKASVVQIREGVELWIKLHPGTKVELAAAPAQPWGAEQLAKQVDELLKTTETILKEDPDQPFSLGMTMVSVTAEGSALSPLADSMDRSEIVNRQALTVGTALDYLPGLSLDRAASRNEAGIRLRGFSNKGQVPLYVDGIPVQVPYDGTMDFNRFLTSDIAEIQVAKGFSSPTLGPNAMGGSINLVTRQPEKKFESDAMIGTGSGDAMIASLHLGSRFDHFYAQGSVDWSQQDYMPLSGNFTLQSAPSSGTYAADRYQTTYHRNQSDFRDEKYSGRIAWTPSGQNEYVFSYINQKGEKGQPLYAGPNPSPSGLKYWRWPSWNKNSYYFISNTGIGEGNSLKLRVFYDQFVNRLAMYDNAYYSTMTGTSGLSYYDDHTDGVSTEFATRMIARNSLSASFFFKDDTHKEYTHYPGQGFVSPPVKDRTQDFSMGFQDVITLTSRLRATFGFSADYHKGLRAMGYSDSSNKTVRAFSCPDNPTNVYNYTACMLHTWNYNPQASLSYNVTSSDKLFITFSDRGRFPLLKDTYSSKFNSSLPNPELKPEHSRNWDAGYSHTFGARTVAQLEYFRNDMRDAIQSLYIARTDYKTVCSKTSLAGYCLQNVNLAQEVHEGAEITLRSTAINRLILDVSYAYLNRRIEFDFTSARSSGSNYISLLPSLPKNKVLFNATGEFPHKVLGIATFRYEGGITLQDTTYSTVPLAMSAASFGVVDLGSMVPVYAGFSFQVGVKNLFDRNYFYTIGYPEAGRNWYFNGRYRF